MAHHHSRDRSCPTNASRTSFCKELVVVDIDIDLDRHSQSNFFWTILSKGKMCNGVNTMGCAVATNSVHFSLISRNFILWEPTIIL